MKHQNKQQSKAAWASREGRFLHLEKYDLQKKAEKAAHTLVW